MLSQIEQLSPDALIVLNHALMPKSLELVETAQQNSVKISKLLLIVQITIIRYCILLEKDVTLHRENRMFTIT